MRSVVSLDAIFVSLMLTTCEPYICCVEKAVIVKKIDFATKCITTYTVRICCKKIVISIFLKSLKFLALN